MRKRFNVKSITPVLLAVLALLWLSGCAVNGNAGGSESPTATLPASAPPTAQPSMEVELGDWDAAAATHVNLNGATISVDGSGVQAQDNVLTITAAGTYVLSGTLDDGQIVIVAGKNDTVQVVLNQADMTNRTGAAIYAS